MDRYVYVLYYFMWIAYMYLYAMFRVLRFKYYVYEICLCIWIMDRYVYVL